jgi:hypothetical protein
MASDWPGHITYATPEASLQQGDVIRRTEQIDSVLQDVHPHYLKEDYRYLMVLTQTCDLVRGRIGPSGRCKARYISVAAVRPFATVIRRELSKYLRHPFEQAHRLCDEKHRVSVRDFVAKLLNNNAAEYFYLHSEPSAGFNQPHCAFLTLSIALKSELHYEKCLDAKLLQLSDSFQHKLGWLTGNLYSRVGTEDWVPDVCEQAAFDARVEAIVYDACAWIESSHQKKLMKRLGELQDLTTERALSEYEALKTKLPKKKDLLVDRLFTIMVEEGISKEDAKRIANLVKSDEDIAPCIAR